MKLITDLKQNCLEPASVALGCFDGIHLGHQAVIGPAVADKMNGLTPSVFTFQENPLQVLTGNTVPTLLAPETRNQIFEEIGVEQVYSIGYIWHDDCVKTYYGMRFYLGTNHSFTASKTDYRTRRNTAG